MDLSILWRSPRLLAAAACFGLGVIVLAVGLFLRLAPPVTPAPAEAGLYDPESDEAGMPAQAPTDERPANVVVYITGAVWYPDVYRLPAEGRVKDVVEAAGGLRPDAAVERVNLAEPLRDAQHIHVPSVTEATAEASAAPGDAGGSQADGLLDLNRASAAELEELPGIGPTLAGRIVARRTEQGPFRTVEELREVPGIGEKLFSQIAPLVTVR